MFIFEIWLRGFSYSIPRQKNDYRDVGFVLLNSIFIFIVSIKLDNTNSIRRGGLLSEKCQTDAACFFARAEKFRFQFRFSKFPSQIDDDKSKLKSCYLVHKDL